MKVIFTKYLPATATKPKRIKAYDQDRNQRTTSLPETNAKDDALHRIACQGFCLMMGWRGCLQGGHTKEGMVWTLLDDSLVTFDQASEIDRRRDNVASRAESGRRRAFLRGQKR